MILRVPVLISQDKFDELMSVQLEVMLLKDNLIMISDLKIESVLQMRGGFWGFLYPNEETYLYITEITVWGWNPEKKFWGITDSEYMTHYILMLYNLATLREKFENIHHSLQALNFAITKVPVHVVLEETHNID